METYKTCKTFRNYQVSNFGNVRDKKTKKLRTIYVNPKTKYLMVSLKKDGKFVLQYVHQLVLHAFKKRKLVTLEVDHIDRNKNNNYLTNLRWVTHRDNMMNRNPWKWKKQ